MSTEILAKTETWRVEAPTLKLNFISHGTLEAKDIAFTRRFYEEFMGFDVVQPSKISLWFRLGGQHIYVCVENRTKAEMPLLNHNGLDVETEERVDECHRLALRDAEKWKLHNQQARDPARHLQLFLLGRRRQLLGDPGQSPWRLQLDVRARRPAGDGPHEEILPAAGIDAARRQANLIAAC